MQQKQKKSRNRKKTVAKKAMASKNNKNNNGVAQSSAPAAYSYRVQSNEPKMVFNQSTNSNRVRHRELVVPQILASLDYALRRGVELNPGLSDSFPWLSSIANNYEQYKVHSLKAEYVPIAPTNTRGDYILAYEYDSYDEDPVSELQLSSYKGAVTDSVWRRCTVPLDTKAAMGLGPRKYVRSTLTSGDYNTFDLGKLYIATVNSTDEGQEEPIGKVFLDYDIEFFSPQTSRSSITRARNILSVRNSATQTIPNDDVPQPISMPDFIMNEIEAKISGSSFPADGKVIVKEGTYEMETQVSSIGKDEGATGNSLLTLEHYVNGIKVQDLATFAGIFARCTLSGENLGGCVLKNVIYAKAGDVLSSALRLFGGTGDAILAAEAAGTILRLIS